MRLQKTTLILLLLALGLGSFVYFHEIRSTTQQEKAAVKNQQLFAFTVDDVQSFTVQKPNFRLVVERNNQPDSFKWLMKSPQQTPASDAAVAYLLNLVAPGNSDRILTIPANQLPEYGFNPPQATIEVQLKNRQTHQLILGKPDFNRRFLYAKVDPPAHKVGNINLYLVSVDFENAVKRELSEWKQAVDIPTPASTPLATPTATPTSKPLATPTATPTSTPLATPTATPISKPLPTPTATPTAKPLATPTSKPQPLIGPTFQPTPQKTPTAKPLPTSTKTPTSKQQPFIGPTFQPSPQKTPTSKPQPLIGPTFQPTPQKTPE